MVDEGEIRVWARDHEAAWEVAPLVEVVKGAGRRQTGFEIRVYAQIEHSAAGEIDEIYARAHEIAEAVVPDRATPLDFEVESYDAGEYERGETGYAREIVVPIQATFEDPDRPPDEQVIHDILERVEQRLQALGLKRKAWNSRR